MKHIEFNPEWSDTRADAAPGARIARSADDESIPVIIAEDDPVSRTLVTAVVKLGGFRTIVTEDGEEAMSALRAQDGPCVAVIDWMMPGMDGAELCRRTRDSNRDVYIIMLTARGAKEDTVEGLEGGADDYLVKPFDRHELLARIRAGVRILNAQMALQNRVHELEQIALHIGSLKLQMPL